MGQFLERCYLQKHSQEKIDNMNRSESTKEIESIISNLLKQKAPGPDIFPGALRAGARQPHRPRAWALPPLRLNSAPLGGPHPQSQVLREPLVPDQLPGDPRAPSPTSGGRQYLWASAWLPSTTRTPGQWGGGSRGLLGLPGTPPTWACSLISLGYPEKRMLVSPSLKNHSAPGKAERLPASPCLWPSAFLPYLPNLHGLGLLLQRPDKAWSTLFTSLCFV